MKRIFGILAAITLPVLAAVTVVSLAQQQQAPEGVVTIKSERVFQGPEGAPPPGDFVFISSEVGFGGKLVKGAPYSAQAVTETIQTLGDGNRIVNKVTSSLYRDSEGRTRREQSIKMLGALGDSGEPLQTIFINDPVAGVSYSLDSRSHIAHKTMPFKLDRVMLRTAPGAPGVSGAVGVPPGAETQRFEVRIGDPSAGGYAVKPGAGSPPGVKVEGSFHVDNAAGPNGEQFKIQSESGGGATYIFRTNGGANHNAVKEQLGKQLIEGVEAEGTRTTVTIPAGEIGNDRAIEIVSERWFSPELQMVVMTRHSDPRSGETIYRLTNITRTEPEKSLFEVPTGYTVKEGMHAAPFVGAAATREEARKSGVTGSHHGVTPEGATRF